MLEMLETDQQMADQDQIMEEVKQEPDTTAATSLLIREEEEKEERKYPADAYEPESPNLNDFQ